MPHCSEMIVVTARTCPRCITPLIEEYASLRAALEEMAISSELHTITVSLTSHRNHIRDKMWSGVWIKNPFFFTFCTKSAQKCSL